jgi:hypothetical protein
MLLLFLAAHAAPFATSYKTRFADVDFSWSAEAAAVPALVRRFKGELAHEKTATIQCGKTETEVRVKSGSEGIACSSSTAIKTEGETPRLLSMSRAYYAFTGGAHGNGATTGLLWDRRLGKEIQFDALFASAKAYGAMLRAPYCRALDKERRKRRGPDYQPGSIAEFDSCPKLSDLALIPADPKQRGRFDRIHLIAAPYLAGPYAEGDYDIELPVSRALIAAMKPEYRGSFAARP